MADARAASARIALVTHAGLPELSVDDGLLVAALRSRGATVEAAVWSEPSVEWHAYDCCVVRSCWDYHLRTAEFFAWLARLESSGARVRNDARVLRWNADKTYLRDLERDGVPVVPTHWVEAGTSAALDDIRRARGWDELVVKPAISGGAYETWRASPGVEGSDARLGAMAASGTVLVQPLLDAVMEEGEWSLIFLGGRFSHAVFKRPLSGDFRVQIEHGGTFAAAAAPDALVAQGERVLRTAVSDPATLAYARVDGCVVDDQLLLMELELIEPALFLGTAEGAADRLAEVVLAAAESTAAARP